MTESRPLSDFASTSVAWLWNGRIPLGKFTLLVGLPGGGKGLTAIDICARVTSGSPMPFGDDLGESAAERVVPRNVVILSNEDDPEDALRPRLEAAGGDPSRAFVLNPDAITIPDEADLIAREVDLRRAVLVWIDLLFAFLTVSPHRDGRGLHNALRSLRNMAREQGCAVVGNIHTVKTTRESMVHRVGGAAAVAGAARTVLAIESGDQESRLSVVKSNLGPRPPVVVFTIEERGGAPAIQWLREEMPMILSPDQDEQIFQRRVSVLEQAIQLLLECLVHGRRRQVDLEVFADIEGISLSTLRRAKDVLGIRSRRIEGAWWWELPEDDQDDQESA